MGGGFTDIPVEHARGRIEGVAEVLLGNLAVPDQALERLLINLDTLPIELVGEAGTPVGEREPKHVLTDTRQDTDQGLKGTALDSVQPVGVLPEPASLLIRHGESVKTVQTRLGHATAAETLDTYSHLWPDSDDRTREAVDQVLRRPPTTPSAASQGLSG